MDASYSEDTKDLFLYDLVDTLLVENKEPIKEGIDADRWRAIYELRKIIEIHIRCLANSFDTYHKLGDEDSARVVKFWIRSMLEDYLNTFLSKNDEEPDWDLEKTFDHITKQHIEASDQRKEEAFERQTA
tara:strand:- start:106 stop:495 length:390 start_codon:yes stop_codon:yes gene_type:complete